FANLIVGVSAKFAEHPRAESFGTLPNRPYNETLWSWLRSKNACKQLQNRSLTIEEFHCLSAVFSDRIARWQLWGYASDCDGRKSFGLKWQDIHWINAETESASENGRAWR